MEVTEEQVYQMTLYQAGAVRAFAEAAGGRLHHLKAHGALYNMAAQDAALSRGLVRAVRALGDGVRMMVLTGSTMEAVARDAGLEVRCEVFADRRYLPDGTLAPRTRPDALIVDEAESVAQVLRMVREGALVALDGTVVPVRADTVCIHGDKPTAVPFVRALRTALRDAGVTVAPA